MNVAMYVKSEEWDKVSEIDQWDAKAYGNSNMLKALSRRQNNPKDKIFYPIYISQSDDKRIQHLVNKTSRFTHK